MLVCCCCEKPSASSEYAGGLRKRYRCGFAALNLGLGVLAPHDGAPGVISAGLFGLSQKSATKKAESARS